MHLLFFCIFETDMFFKCQSLSKLADIFLPNEEFLFKQIDTFRENLVFLWNKDTTKKWNTEE